MKITIVLPNGKKLEHNLDKSSVIVGRSKDCEFQIDDEVLSRKHCRIEEVDGNFYVTDLGSTNGVQLNGERIPSEKKVLYDTFLQLHIGPLECFLESTEIKTAHVDLGTATSAPISAKQRPKKATPSGPDKATKPNLAVIDKSEAKSKLGVYFSLLALLAMFGYFIMEVFNKSPDTTTAPEKISAPAEVRDITVL